MEEPTLKQALRDLAIGLIPLVSLFGGCYYAANEIGKEMQKADQAIVDSKEPSSKNTNLCANKLFSAKSNPSAPEPTFEQRIEKEMARMDPWVKDWVQSDYTEGAKFRPVSIRRETDEYRAKKRAQGFLPTYASYRFESNHLLIPDGKDAVAQGISALPHELWHVVYEDFGVKGLTSSKLYTGPSRLEIERFAKEKSEARGREGIREELKTASVVFDLDSKIEDFGMKVQAIDIVRGVIGPIVREAALSRMYLLRYMSRRERNSALRPVAYLRDTKPMIFLDVLASIGERYAKLKGAKQQKAVLDRVRGVFRDVDKTLARSDYAFEDTIRMLKCFDRVEDRLNDARCRSIGGVPIKYDEVSVLERQAGYTRIECAKQDFLEYRRELYANLNGNEGSKNNSVQFLKILQDTDEVMARVIESLYSLYTGPFATDQYPLTRSDLDFLDRFTYRGGRVFGKGVDRYRSFIGLIESKLPVDVARAKAYKSVPEIEFKVTGVIPAFAPPPHMIGWGN